MAALWCAALWHGARPERVHTAVSSHADPGAKLRPAQATERAASSPGSAPAQRATPLPAPPRPVPGTPTPNEQATGPAPVPSNQVTSQQRWHRVEQAFAAEVPDPAWHPEAAFRALFAHTLPAGSALDAIECRSSLCRVETSHLDSDGRLAFLSALAMPDPTHPLGFAAALFGDSVPSPDGRGVRSIMYVLRSGRELPTVDGSLPP